MATVQVAIVNRAYRLLHQTPRGVAPSTEESADGLVALNAMTDAWNLSSLLKAAHRVEVLTLTASATSKTIGPSGADLTSARPLAILEAWIVDGGISYPVRVVNDTDYAGITNKALVGSWPSVINYKATYPSGTVYPWPLADASRSLNILTEIPFGVLALTDTLAVPPGWERALAYNLAVEMAPECETEAGPDVVRIARESLADIKRRNIPRLQARSELVDLVGVRVSGNILTDQ